VAELVEGRVARCGGEGTATSPVGGLASAAPQGRGGGYRGSMVTVGHRD
jgi:hypothetical protein